MSAGASGRRDLFGGAAALLAAAALPAMADAAPNADASLIAACDCYVRAELEWRRLLYAVGDAAAGRYADAVRDPAMNAVVALPPASTMAGLRAKAAVIVAFYDPDPPDEGPFESALWEVLTVLAGPDVSAMFRQQRETLAGAQS